MKSFLQFIKEASRNEKGWVNSKTGKVILWSGMSPYHVQYVAKNLSKFGLKEKEVLDTLEARYDNWGTPEPRDDAEHNFLNLQSGSIDIDYTVKYLAMKKGWCRVVLGEWSEIGGKDFKQIHQAAKKLNNKKEWIDDILGLELVIYDESDGPIKKGYDISKKSNTIDNSFDVRRWTDGKNPDPSKIGKGRSDIGNTMAQFR
jgi:hypothetical protein